MASSVLENLEEAGYIIYILSGQPSFSGISVHKLRILKGKTHTHHTFFFYASEILLFFFSPPFTLLARTHLSQAGVNKKSDNTQN